MAQCSYIKLILRKKTVFQQKVSEIELIFFAGTLSKESGSTNPMIFSFGNCPLNKFFSFSGNEPIRIEMDFIITHGVYC